MEKEVDPFRFKNQEQSAALEGFETYVKFVDIHKQKGCKLDNIDYPSLFGPQGELLGISAGKYIAAGETIMSYPFSVTTDKISLRRG